MSTERDVAYILRSWLRTESDGSVDHVVDAILSEVDTTRQRRSTWWPARRSLDMNTIMKFGIAAVVLAVTAALGYGLWQNVGNLVPDPQPSDDASPPGGELPREFHYTFVGATRDVEGLNVEGLLALDFSGQIFAVQTGGDLPEIASKPTITGAGELRLETVVDTTVCQLSDVGTYAYAFSRGETVLRIELLEDDCAERADAVPGEWRRSACHDPNGACLGILEAGTQASLWFDPFSDDWPASVARHGALRYQVPDGWANSDDSLQLYALTRAEAYGPEFSGSCLDCPDGISMIASPAVVEPGCSEEPDPDVGTSAQALVQWVRAHPGLLVTEGPATAVDGRQATVLDITASESWADACLDEANQLSFVPLFTNRGYTYGIRTGDRHRLLFVEMDSDTALGIGIDSFDPDDLDALITDAQPIIESIRLTAP
jgi:hypothetical protein